MTSALDTDTAEAENLEAYTWVAPTYNTSRIPECLYTSYPFSADTVQTSSHDDFVRVAKWCPDGSSALAQCESGHLQFLDLPQRPLTATYHGSDDSTAKLMPRLHQPAPIVDFAWYPVATRRDPATFCFVASVRECPVKLIDASDGRLRASYKIVDHRERQIAPHSLAFNPVASKLYCGFEDAIEVFDVHYPGEGTRLHTTPSKKSRDGLKGIISTLAFASDASSGVYAAGSLNPSPTNSSNVALFSEATGETPLMFVGDEINGAFGIKASAMQVMFNPVRPYLLYASFRRHDTIYCWDVRGDTGVPVQKLMTDEGLVGSDESVYPRPGRRQDSTNQKLRFDSDLGGKYLSIGDHNGYISLFDLSTCEQSEQPVGQPTTIVKPTLKYRAHDDTIGSVGFHPLSSLLLSVSGSRHFLSSAEGESDAEDDEPAEENEHEHGGVIMSREPPRLCTNDNSVKLWQF